MRRTSVRFWKIRRRNHRRKNEATPLPPKCCGILLWGWVVYASVPGCGWVFLWRVLFPDGNIETDNVWVWCVLFIQSFMPGWQKKYHWNPYVSTHLFPAEKHGCLAVVSFIFHGILSLVFPFSSLNWFGVSSTFKFHPKWTCVAILLSVCFKKTKRNLTSVSGVSDWRARDFSCRGGSQQPTEKLHRDVFFPRKDTVEIYLFSQFYDMLLDKPILLLCLYIYTYRDVYSCFFWYSKYIYIYTQYKSIRINWKQCNIE